MIQFEIFVAKEFPRNWLKYVYRDMYRIVTYVLNCVSYSELAVSFHPLIILLWGVSWGSCGEG